MIAKLRSILTLETLFRLLPWAAIPFQSGIAGAWWSQQFVAPLPPWWGWFGAAIIGLTMFGGVEIAIKGRRAGWLLAGIAGVADTVMAWAYFGPGHEPVVAIPLAMAPASLTLLLAYLSGLFRQELAAHVAVAQTNAQATAAAAIAHQRQIEAERLAWQLAQDAADREAQRQAALIHARAEARTLTGHSRTPVQPPSTPVHPFVPPVQTPPPPTPTPADRVHWLSTHPDAYDPDALASAWGVHERTARRTLSAAGYHPNGDGRWHLPQTP